MTTPINLTQRRRLSKAYKPNDTIPYQVAHILALIDTAEAAIDFVLNANIATVQKTEGVLLKHAGTSTIHSHGDKIERLRETLNHYTTTD
jgi:hypothetical protein